MAELATWIEAHKETLVVQVVRRLSDRELLRKYAEGPVRWFFDSMIDALVQGHSRRLESLLRNWVRLCSVPIDGEPIGVLPVLGVFKQVLWQEFRADPPSENALELAIEMDNIIVQATEFLAKLEAAALMDAINHQVVTRLQTQPSEDQSKENFIAVAGHELKTPLTVIEGYANMLKLEVSDGNTRATLMLQGIETGVGRLRSLIEDLIDVSLLDSGLFQLEYQPVWLRRMLEIARTDVRDVLRQRRISLEIDHESIPSKPTIGDPAAILKAIRKVLENAIKYTPDGGQISISGCQRNEFVDIVVRDSGIGIAPEHIERIFEKFSPLGDVAHHSSSKFKFKGGGAGLGLVIARGICEAHGGTVWAESDGHDENRYPGSAFHLVLPLRDAVTGKELSPVSVVSSGSNGKTGKFVGWTEDLAVSTPAQESVKPLSEPTGDTARRVAVRPGEPPNGKDAYADETDSRSVEQQNNDEPLAPKLEGNS